MYHETKIFVTVDCIVFGFDGTKLKLLSTKSNSGAIEQFTLISGFVTTVENVDDAVARIMSEATGFNEIHAEQIGAFSRFREEYGEVALSIAYFVVVRTEQMFCPIIKDNLRWISRRELLNNQPHLHPIIEGAFQKLRQKAFSNPERLGLLSQKFTWTQLHKLYEAIAEKRIDKRNLQKKITSLKIITRLNEKEKSGSKKGSFLYSYKSQGQYKPGFW